MQEGAGHKLAAAAAGQEAAGRQVEPVGAITGAGRTSAATIPGLDFPR